MKNMIKLKDVTTDRLYAFLTPDLADQFCDEFDHPENLVRVDTR